MGKKIDALLGRTFKAYKFKPTVSLAISRLSVLKNQRQARTSVARSDVVELLNLGHHDRALIRVEQVIKEQNMFDVFIAVEGYCNLLIERLSLLEKERVCPDELEEVVSSLIYASTRCGEFPELLEMRAVFVSRFGKEFAARAMELRNNCRVNIKMVQKLSTRQPNLESRMKVLKEIASEIGVVLQIEDKVIEEKLDVESKWKQPKLDLPTNTLNDHSSLLPEDIEKVEESMKGRRKYKDVADAAQAAFESAAYAAAAARAAVELSRSESHDPDDDQNRSNHRQNKVLNAHHSKNTELNAHAFENFQTEVHRSVSEDEKINLVNETDGSKQKKNETEFSRPVSGYSSDSDDNVEDQMIVEEEVLFDGSDVEDDNKQGGISFSRTQDSDYDMKKLASERTRRESPLHLNFGNKPMSVRTKRVYGR